MCTVVASFITVLSSFTPFGEVRRPCVEVQDGENGEKQRELAGITVRLEQKGRPLRAIP